MDKWDKLRWYIEYKIQYSTNLDVNTLYAVLNEMGNLDMNESLSCTIEEIAESFRDKTQIQTINSVRMKKGFKPLEEQ